MKFTDCTQGKTETAHPLTFCLGEDAEIEISVFFAKKNEKVPRNEYTKWFDCDKMIESLVLRYRQPGDYLTIADGNGGTVHKRLKDYLITEKVPRQERGRIPVLAEGSHILWLVGYRISESFKVDENTKRILQVKLLRGCPGSGTEEKGGGAHQGVIVGGGSGGENPPDRGTDQQGL